MAVNHIYSNYKLIKVSNVIYSKDIETNYPCCKWLDIFLH